MLVQSVSSPNTAAPMPPIPTYTLYIFSFEQFLEAVLDRRRMQPASLVERPGCDYTLGSRSEEAEENKNP